MAARSIQGGLELKYIKDSNGSILRRIGTASIKGVEFGISHPLAIKLFEK